MIDRNTAPHADATCAAHLRRGTARLSLCLLGLGIVLTGPRPAGSQATAASAAAAPSARALAGAEAIRPFRFRASDEQLADLRRRVLATKWPGRETVPDASQGVPLATMQKLARHWATDYDWRRFEARLNALPQFVTNIDGLDIHFVHVRSKHANALPVIVTHGWPGSIIEQLKIVDPLVNPTAHGGKARHRGPVDPGSRAPGPLQDAAAESRDSATDLGKTQLIESALAGGDMDARMRAADRCAAIEPIDIDSPRS
jgi:hypothetical protein